MPRTIVALLWFLYVGMGIGFYMVNESFDPLNFFEKFDFFTVSSEWALLVVTNLVSRQMIRPMDLWTMLTRMRPDPGG